MPRRLRPAGLESSVELARKVQVLEQELAIQRAAMEKLKQMAVPRDSADPDASEPSERPS